MLLKKSRYSRNRNRWQYLFKPWQQTDLLLFLLPVIISIFGGFAILSTVLNQDKSYWWVHLLVAGVGLLLALLIARTRYESLQKLHWVTYTLTNISLIAVMAIGVSAKGAQRWITVGGFNVQPSEFAKIGVIITLAALLHKRTADTLPNFFRALATTAVPWGLVFLQPDLATSLVFGAIVLGMLYWANANPGWLILLVSPIVAAILFSTPWPWSEPILLSKDIFFTPLGLIWSITMGLVGWRTLPGKRFGLGGIGALALNLLGGEIGIFIWNHLLKEYQKGRITSFLDPEQDPLGTGYHLIQSRIAIGAGEWFGSGPFNGAMTQLNFVPEQHTDFIFSAVGEQFGFIGSVVLLLGFCLLCQRLLHIALTAKDNFGSLLAIGVLAMIVFQLVVNIGMTIGLAPVAGIPLPFMSYGGSAMLANFIGVGLVESVANFRQLNKY
ncbi:rod shape-determining protein RodA [Rivularia sp. UHCC 0363]|uniref:rod shape-determining protein RodA n=1 Tax=Rivularia sp. UHCC 0363 TaxID=3110244 RepID=UPI002B204F34|nr:rod shape-determining protein RodA [Rivularia sp. UHCC 0363]MEA5596546.1 rod shape-determining protein RodA [Rivularia sp. UHCC 0363]